MNKKWNAVRVIGLVLAVISLVCFAISMVKDGNKIFLNVGLFCMSIGLILNILMNRKEK